MLCVCVNVSFLFFHFLTFYDSFNNKLNELSSFHLSLFSSGTPFLMMNGLRTGMLSSYMASWLASYIYKKKIEAEKLPHKLQEVGLRGTQLYRLLFKSVYRNDNT